MMSIQTKAILLTVLARKILLIAAHGNRIGLQNLKEQLEIESDRKAVQTAMENVQRRMLEGLYESVELMEKDLEFEIELQKKLNREQ